MGLALADSGITIDNAQYYAYGRTRYGGIGLTDYRFTGQKQDATGLMYFNARYYDPELGQFISPDTLVPDPSNLFDYNRYMYSRGNPLKFVDPTGHCSTTMPDATKDREGYEEFTNCWTKANTILQQWDATPDYWNNRFTSKEVFLKYVASVESNGSDLFDVLLLNWQQSEEYIAKYGQSSSPATPEADDLGCGNDRACQAVVRHALYMNQKCQEIDCIGIGNDIVGVVATGTVAVACVPGLAACASIAAVAGPIATSSTLFGAGWSIYAWSNDKASNNDLTVTLLNAGASIVTDRLAPGLYEAQTAYSLLQLIYDAAPRE